MAKKKTMETLVKEMTELNPKIEFIGGNPFMLFYANSEVAPNGKNGAVNMPWLGCTGRTPHVEGVERNRAKMIVKIILLKEYSKWDYYLIKNILSVDRTVERLAPVLGPTDKLKEIIKEVEVELKKESN